MNESLQIALPTEPVLGELVHVTEGLVTHLFQIVAVQSTEPGPRA
jgi:hypothetical protein